MSLTVISFGECGQYQLIYQCVSNILAFVAVGHTTYKQFKPTLCLPRACCDLCDPLINQ